MTAERNIEVHALHWRGVAIEITFERDWLSIAREHELAASHLTVTAVQPKGAPLPITETGYRSHFLHFEDIDEAGEDVALVRDVADALKHSILTRHLDQRQVAAAEAVLALSTGYGELAFGEGKFGGVEQIVVLTNAGPRALSSVLQNAIDAWRTVAGFELPAVGEGAA